MNIVLTLLILSEAISCVDAGMLRTDNGNSVEIEDTEKYDMYLSRSSNAGGYINLGEEIADEDINLNEELSLESNTVKKELNMKMNALKKEEAIKLKAIEMEAINKLETNKMVNNAKMMIKSDSKEMTYTSGMEKSEDYFERNEDEYGFFQAHKNIGFDGGINDEEPNIPDGSIQSKTWMEISSNNLLSTQDAWAFSLDMGKLAISQDKESINISKFQTSNQTTFAWNSKLGKVVSRRKKKFAFLIRKGSKVKTFKAFYIGSANAPDLGEGKYLWSGIIAKSKKQVYKNPLGDISCYAEFETLSCQYRLFRTGLKSASSFTIRGEKLILEVNPFSKEASLDEEEDEEDHEELQQPIETIPFEVEPETGNYGASSIGQGINYFGNLPNVLTNSNFTTVTNNINHQGVSSRTIHAAANDRETEIIVFYTEESGDGGEHIENKIKLHVALFNDALRRAGVTNRKAYLKLVSLWGLFRNEYKDWIGTELNSTSRDNFYKYMNSRRKLVGADIMVLIHDWSGGYFGQAKFNYPHSITDVDYIHENTFQHEIGHTFSLYHSDANNQIHTLMEQGTKKINRWSSTSASIFNLSDRSKRLDHLWNYLPTRSVTRIQPCIDGELKSWAWRRCGDGIKGLGLTRYRHENGDYDFYDMPVICGSGRRYNLESTGYGKGHRVSESILSCNGRGNLIRGVVLYRYRYGRNDYDLYQIGVICRYGGWKYSGYPGGSFLSYAWSANWKVGTKKFMDFIKLNRYREGRGDVDTYSLDVGFDH